MFGLNPYSSTSLRRSSSAALFALRLRQKKSSAKIINATETTGTTTATAIVPLGERPPELAAEVEVASAAESVALEEVVDEAPVLAAVWVDVITTTVVPCVDVNVVSWALEVVEGAVVVEEVVEGMDEVVVDEVDVGSGVDVVLSGAGVLLVLLVVVLVVVGSAEVVVGAAVDEEVVELEEVVGWAADVSLVDASLVVSAAEAEVCAAVSVFPAPIDGAVTAAALDGEAIFKNNFGQCWLSVKNR